MKYSVLILEDNHEKEKIVSNMLEEAGYRVEWADSLNRMKDYLTKERFDILIIDMYMCENDLENPKNCGGLDAINYIRDTESTIHKPNGIIILSEYADNHNMYSDLQKRGYCYPIISYEPGNTDWFDQLLMQIDISVAMSGRRADILIAVAVDVELDYILKAQSWKSFTIIGDDVTYYTNHISTENNGTLTVVLFRSNKMGPIACTDVVAKAIHRFRPHYVFMVGIAAGKKGSVDACDIVVATEATDYSYGKITEKDNNIEFIGRASTIEIERFIRQKFDNYRIDPSERAIKYVREEAKRTAINELKYNDLCVLENLDRAKIVLGKVVSGPCVVASQTFINRYIMPSHSDYRALDMETYSVYYAAKHAEMAESIKFVSIKAISDMGDTDKSDVYQKICVLEAFYLVMYYITNDLSIKY